MCEAERNTPLPPFLLVRYAPLHAPYDGFTAKSVCVVTATHPRGRELLNPHGPLVTLALADMGLTVGTRERGVSFSLVFQDGIKETRHFFVHLHETFYD